MKQAHIMACTLLAFVLTGCSCTQDTSQASPSPVATPSLSPAPSTTPGIMTNEVLPGLIPDRLFTNDKGEPVLNVYVVADQSVQSMEMESYLQGVVAAEMENDWPMEALKAQAILARTYALRFIEDSERSQYPGADLSTDVSEAQAYDLSRVNARVIKAVEETRGEVIVYQGETIYAWFHAHAGGVTAGAQEGLGWEKAEPRYIRSIQIRESEKAPPEAKSWTAEFSYSAVQNALNALGGGDATKLAIGERGTSGRVITFTAGTDTSIPAPAFRLALDGTKMRSTFISDLKSDAGVVTMRGAGYGHGVGMSQWGAYEMASEGKSAEEIITKFFTNIQIAKAYS